MVNTEHEIEPIYIPIDAVHRLENSSKIQLELNEVQLGEDDIIRIEGDYSGLESIVRERDRVDAGCCFHASYFNR